MNYYQQNIKSVCINCQVHLQEDFGYIVVIVESKYCECPCEYHHQGIIET